MRQKIFGENFLSKEKILRWKWGIKHLEKILYLKEKFLRWKWDIKQFIIGENFIVGEKILRWKCDTK